jgi:hypothetical protein
MSTVAKRNIVFVVKLVGRFSAILVYLLGVIYKTVFFEKHFIFKSKA